MTFEIFAMALIVLPTALYLFVLGIALVLLRVVVWCRKSHKRTDDDFQRRFFDWREGCK